jgi:protein kinase A
VKKHKWFKGMDWAQLVARQIPAPFAPPHSHEGDTSNFEKYEEIDLDEEMRATGVDPFKGLFKDF